MAFKVRMPRVDANVEEGAIGRWLIACGEPVRAGHPLVEIITDKASFELEADEEGILRRQVAAEKSVVPVGYIIAVIGKDSDEALPDVDGENEALLTAYRQAVISGLGSGAAELPPSQREPGRAAISAGAAEGVVATPAARRLASQAGLSIEEISHRLRGLVRRQDVENELRRRKGDSVQ
jgi:pyruvate dehydrogenase E2 component (dihydrolipoamide acetyltransferase)